MKENKKMEAQGESLWKQLQSKRDDYIDRARECALLTIPQLYPPEGKNPGDKYPTPYQSLGSKGVNNLANKVVLALFPPGQAFFKLGLNPADIKATGKAEGDIKEAMYALERTIVNDMELSYLRPRLVDLIKLLLVGGSAVIYVPSSGTPEVFNLTDFVVSRDKQGNVLKLVIKQSVMFNSLSKAIQDSLTDLTDEHKNSKKELELYTVIIKDSSGMYDVWQEVHKTIIPTTKGKYKKDDLPYRFIPFVDRGEDYGRSYLEDFIGDLQSYEGLRQAILEASAESAKIIYLLKPGSTINLRKLEKAKSGDVVMGNITDVGTLQADKRLDLAVTQKESDNLRQELAVTFLLDSAVRRNAERVTAEEIRTVSQELEVALGGIYSTLSNILQAPLVKLYINRLVKAGKLNPILKNSVELEITTGSAALGRGADFQTMTTFVATLGQLAVNPAIQGYVNMEELIKRLAYSLDINTASLVYTEQQRQAMAAAAQQEQVLTEAAPKVIAEQAKAQTQQE